MLLLPLLSLAGAFGKDHGGQHWQLLERLTAALGVHWNIQFALLLFVFLIFLQSFLGRGRDRECHSLQIRFADHLRKTLYRAISRSSWSFLASNHSGKLLNTLTSEVQRIQAGTFFFLRFFTVAVLGLAYLAVAVRLSPALTLLALAAGLLLWFLLHGADDAARYRGKALGEANRALLAEIQEFLSAMKLVKIHGEEEGSVERFEREVDEVNSRFIEFQEDSSRARVRQSIGGAVTLAALSWAALSWFKLHASHVLVMIAIFSRMLPQLGELQQGRQQLLHMLPAFASWKSMLLACEANRDSHESGGPSATLRQGIVFDHVAFSHGQSRHKISIGALAIPARKTTAIVGVSGSGKTTLLDLLSGLIPPDSGSIKVDGLAVREIPAWRKSIAYIPQETLILGGTLRDNLVWGNARPSEEEMWDALAQAALAETVRRMPHGLETEIGERGVKLSGGEKQRLARARALLRRPQLLILDEATSALDAKNQRLVLDSIRTMHGSTTVLIVTHRIDEFSGLIDGLVRVTGGEVGAWEQVPPDSPGLQGHRPGSDRFP